LEKVNLKKRARIKIQPRLKIQYPMKNRNKDISGNKEIIIELNRNITEFKDLLSA